MPQLFRPNGVWLFAIACTATFACGDASCGDAPRRPNVVWINCEDLDDALGCYGDAYASTPRLDALARESVLYRQAIANAPICSPARSCLVTGVYPTSLGTHHLRCETALPDAIRPLSSLLREQGYYATSAFKTDYNFSAEDAFDYRGDSLAPWRGRAPDQPFFSFIVLGTTHEGPANNRQRYNEATRKLPDDRRHNPQLATLPPYFPDTPRLRELWAQYYDLTSAMDLQVGEILTNLRQDGLLENTVVWFFSDHGFGVPRHKRWLLDSGLRVPLLIRFPENFPELAGGLERGSETERLVSFVDFAPTTLSQATASIPAWMRGKVFTGPLAYQPREFAFAARDRADDMFELSRAVHSGRYLYVRNYLPHLPNFQGGRINSNAKEFNAALRAPEATPPTAAADSLWRETKPLEEFYDLQSDPWELCNLADAPEYEERIASYRQRLHSWILAERDVAFLPEAEAQRRASEQGRSIYTMARDDSAYALREALAAAERVGQSPNPVDLKSAHAEVRYWGVVALQAQLDVQPSERSALIELLDDPCPSVAVAAAE
ncbi:MAG: sulfatase, partial [Planctomycetales bacterium]|nr:sulfatase [Planctomycetales bacterium]